jgi:hypothetical protein
LFRVMDDIIYKDPKTFPAVGRCIYCPSTEHLTDEHIVPFGLGGRLILPKASCRACSEITKKFEQRCLRGILGPLRLRMNFPTRHPKDRPTHLDVVRSNWDGTSTPLAIPLEDHPQHLFLIKLVPPGIMRGAQPDTHVEYMPWLATNPSDFERFTEKYGGFGIRGPKKFWIHQFVQMLAKIAHSYAVADKGLDAFEPFLLPLIIGQDLTWPYLVGGDLA